MAAKIQGLQSFKDNYIWMIYDTDARVCICFDPGEAAPVKKFVEQTGCQLTHIFITHHHWDHTNGVKPLSALYQPKIIGPANETIIGKTDAVIEGDRIDIPQLNLQLYVIETPGHTKGHISYYGNGMLFCGDTLFTGGCGRLFEGTPEQMSNSLNKLSQLPQQTRVYCAHEYTLSNLRFAQIVEPYNPSITERISFVTDLRRRNLPSVPSSLEEELATNPFLRTNDSNIIKAAEHKCGHALEFSADVFAVLRQWKDNV